jgi:hypothetical protein
MDCQGCEYGSVIGRAIRIVVTAAIFGIALLISGIIFWTNSSTLDDDDAAPVGKALVGISGAIFLGIVITLIYIYFKKPTLT